MTIFQKHAGTFFMIAAAVFFSLGGVLCKSIPWNALAINGARSLIAAALVFAYMKWRHLPFVINKVTLTGALCMMLVTTLFVLANKLTFAANAIILQYTAPLWIVCFSYFFFRRRPKRYELACLACVFGGILCFFYDSLRGGNVLGDGAALVSGLFYAGLFLINSFKEGDALSAVFLGQLACGLFFGPLALQEKDMSFNVLGCVLALGVLQSGLGYICLAEATKRISALKASLIGAIEPVLNPLLAAWLCQEWLSLLSLAGAGMVIGTVLVYQLISVKENERD